MEILILIACVSIGQSFPVTTMDDLITTNQTNNQEVIEITSGLPNTTMLSVMQREIVQDSRNNSIQDDEILRAIEKINTIKNGRSKTYGTFASFAVGGLLAVLDVVNEVIDEGNTHNFHLQDNVVRMRRDKNQADIASTTAHPQTTMTNEDLLTTTASYVEISTNALQVRQENVADNEVDSNEKKNGRIEASGDNQEYKEDSEEEEGDGGGLIGAIISGFLGSLSKPDGSVDVNAVVSVIGSLSAMKEDGSYDFTGLSDTLNAFFGGDDEGGSDVGSFLGGLIAAAIKGVANPPGAKGAGTLTGNLVKQVLPAISGPGLGTDGSPMQKPEVNAGGYLGGLLNSLFGGNAPSGVNGRKTGMFHTIKTNLFKFVFSALSSILATSSSSGKMPES